MVHRINIVWITPGFAADEADSQCIPPLQLLARELAKVKTIRLQIIALHYPHKTKPFDWHGLRVYPCHLRGPLSRLRIGTRAFRYLLQIHREQAVDGLHSFWLTDAALLAHWASRYLRRPHWVTLMGQDALPDNRYLRFLPVRRMNTIALSPFHAATWQKSTGSQVQALIPWGMPPLEAPAGDADRPIDLLGVGNLIPLKDYTLFVELVAALKIQRPPLKALLIGDGVEREALERQIEERGLKDHLSLTGALPRKQVMEYMRQSKVLFHPSTYESFGFVLLEALAHGLHLVSRPVGIAKASPRWWIGDTPSELLAALTMALDTFDQAVPTFPHPLSETLRQYLELYKNFSADLASNSQ